MSDQQLLCDYAEHHSDAAFGELVRRHLDAVYSAALRMTAEEQSARDTAQAVFVALAQNSTQLADHPVLSGWLHCTARNLAAKSVRSEVRRRAREQEAAAMNQLLTAESVWEHVAPHLDAALGELTVADRDALMLRYFEKKSAPEMSGILGISEDAAQKRVSRAVEKLRDFFAKRGVTVGAGGVVVVLSANAVQAAPVGLAATITAAALSGTTITTTALISTTKAIVMTTLQKTLITVTIAATVGVGIYEAKQAANARAELQTLQPLAEQIQQLQHERDEATNRLAGMADELAQANRNNRELLKLRGEIGVLRQQSNEVGKLRQANQKLLTQNAEQSNSTNLLSAEDQFTLRQTHAVDAMSTLLNAIKSYAANHNGQYPERLDQLTASGDLGTTNFAGNLGFDDFELNPEGAVDPQGDKVILSIRVPIQRPGRESVLVWGCINSAGLTHIADDTLGASGAAA